MFVVLLEYTASLAEIDQHIEAHRQFLARQYADGVFLLSGRQEPRTGGVILARANSREALEQVLTQDPFSQQRLAKYTVIEFMPSMSADGLAHLIEI